MSVLLSRFCHVVVGPRQLVELGLQLGLTVCSSSFSDCISSFEVVSSSLVLCSSSLVDCSSSLVERELLLRRLHLLARREQRDARRVRGHDEFGLQRASLGRADPPATRPAGNGSGRS